MANEYAVLTSGLSKMYKENLAVNGLDLQVARGSIFGFLGLNGAGKTTTIKMLLNLVYPSSGQGAVLGYDIVDRSLEIRAKVGYVPEEPVIYEYMKVSEVLDFCRNSYQKWDMQTVGKYLDLFELSVHKKVKELSKGMKNQLALAAALGSRPELLILDEPSHGLDPVKTRDFYRVIVEQVAETGQTVFFSSHNLHEVERVADTIGIIHKGKMVFNKSLDDIKGKMKTIRVVMAEGVTPEEAIKEMDGVTSVKVQGRGYIIDCNGEVEAVVDRLRQFEPIDLEIIDLGLEDIFVKYTGGEGSVR